jgi:hypothetical protein
MRRTFSTVGLWLVIGIFTAPASPAAEAIRLRPMSPIYVDQEGAGIRQPEGVGCGGKSILLVADSGNGRILQYIVAANSLTPSASIVLSQVPYPIRVQADSKGDIFALDGRLRKIARISPSGEFQGYVEMGGATGGTVVPRSFRIGKDDNIYLLDIHSARVLVLDRAGKVQRQISFPEQYGFFSDLDVDSGGKIFLIDSVGKRVFFAPKGADAFSAAPESLEEHAGFPTSLAVDEKGYIYVIDQHGGSIVILGPDGSFLGKRLSMGWKDGFLRYPSQACIDENGNLFIANRGNNRIEVLSTAR